MGLLDQVDSDLKAAMLARDEVRKRTLRSVKTAAQNALVEKRGVAGPDAALTDDEVLMVIVKQARQRRESIEEFTRGGRPDLAAEEQADLAVLEPYLPQQMSRDEISRVLEQVIAGTGASGAKDMGLVMRTAMPQLQGKADGKVVNEIARELLNRAG